MKFKRLLIAALTGCVVSNTSATPLQDSIEADYEYLDTLFKYLHANPELSMQEFKTSDRIAGELMVLGFKVTRGINKTGLVGILKNGDGPTLMIRADMDGLPVQEKTGLPYASPATQTSLETIEMPFMHACAQYRTMTTVAGLARL